MQHRTLRARLLRICFSLTCSAAVAACASSDDFGQGASDGSLQAVEQEPAIHLDVAADAEDDLTFDDGAPESADGDEASGPGQDLVLELPAEVEALALQNDGSAGGYDTDCNAVYDKCMEQSGCEYSSVCLCCIPCSLKYSRCVLGLPATGGGGVFIP